MLPYWLEALLGVFAVSLVSLIGAATLNLTQEKLRKLVEIVLPLAAGALLGDALLHLMPEAYQVMSPVAVASWVLLGLICFFALEQTIHNGQRSTLSTLHSTPDTGIPDMPPEDLSHVPCPLPPDTNPNPKTQNPTPNTEIPPPGRLSPALCPLPPKTDPILPIGPLSIAANSVHNFVDGVVVAGTFSLSPTIGFATLVAVFLHEIPHEAANYGILLHAKYERKKAVYLNFYVGMAAMAGAVAALLIGAKSHAFIAALLPFTAGCFIYMACADLIPSILHAGSHIPASTSDDQTPGAQTRSASSAWSVVLILIGVAMMYGLLIIEPR